MTPRGTTSRLARRIGFLVPCVAGALARILPGCAFPEVTFGEGPADGGGLSAFAFDAAVPDEGFSVDDAAATTVDVAAPNEAAFQPDAGTADAMFPGDAGCDFNGTWATRITIGVTWQPQGLTNLILQPGSGTIMQWVKGVRVQSPDAPRSLMDDSVVCGIALPDFQATALGLNEVYGVRFPDTLFDDQYVPPFTVSGALDEQMTKYSTTQTAVLLGLTMNSPTTDPWPATVPTAVDMDNDGNPGVTIGVAHGPLATPTISASSYSYIPTEILIPPPIIPAPGASSLYVAIRQITVTTGTVQDCNTITGTVSIPVIESKPAIDSHILGCALVDGGHCTTGTSSQTSFLDNSEPVFTPTNTTSFKSVRLAAGATCADVRAALPRP
jgi:hypothetical protein